jgi:hypothetical protein
MSEHTPAPWYVSGTSGREHEVRLLTNDGAIPIMGPDPDQEAKRIALVDCQTRHKRGQGWQTECAEREANARLIAAAPELLTELRQLVMDADDSGITAHYKGRGFDESIERARAAIAKATGGAA